MTLLRVLVVIGSRANYASIRSFLELCRARKNIQIIIVASTSAILAEYGDCAALMAKDGFKIDYRIYNHVAGENLLTMTRSIGLKLIDLPAIFTDVAPDAVLTIGDRYETIATSIAAAGLNIPLLHTMGGEVSGTIDEKFRHSITKLADYHFVATEGARKRVIQMGESADRVCLSGCPRIDYVNTQLKQPKPGHVLIAGKKFGLEQPFLLLSQHPVTTEYERQSEHLSATLEAVSDFDIRKIILWPNSDGGSNKLVELLRSWRKRCGPDVSFVSNLSFNDYIRLMDSCSVLVGNSSSGIREGAFIGTPVVNVGSRQARRERGLNVIDTSPDRHEISEAINEQIKVGRYDRNNLYGDGRAAERMLEYLIEQPLITKSTFCDL